VQVTNVVDWLARTPLSQVLAVAAVCTALRMVLVPYLKNTAVHQRFTPYKVAGFFNEFLDAVIYAGIFVFLVIRPFVVQAFMIPSGSMVPTLMVGDFVVANKAVYRYSNPQEGDIVVFRPPVRAATPDQLDSNGDVKVDFIKRCIGVPGDVIEIKDDVLYRNGVKTREPYVHYMEAVPGTNMTKFSDLTSLEMEARPAHNFKLIDFRGRVMPLVYTGDLANADGMPIANEYKLDNPEDMKEAIATPACPVPADYYLMMGDNRDNSYDSRGWGLVPRDNIIGRSEAIWLPPSDWGLTRNNNGTKEK